MIRTSADLLNVIGNAFFVNVQYGTQFASRYREILAINFTRNQCRDINNRLMFDTGLSDSLGRRILIDEISRELWVRASTDARALGPIKGYVHDEWVRPTILGDEEMAIENKRIEMLRKEGIKIS
jgi:hypothetical protein